MKDWLINIALREQGNPAFVAVEYDEHFYKTVVPQRQKLRGIMQSRSPHASESFLKSVAASLLYDADTHHEVFPNAPILWLVKVEPNQIRHIINHEITYVMEEDGGASTYTEQRVKIYLDYLTYTNSDEEQVMLREMSRQAWSRSIAPDPTRD